MGFDVKVIHFKSVFPSIFYKLANLLRPLAIWYAGNDKLDTAPVNTDKIYNLESIEIYSLPIFKIFPHRRYSKKVLETSLQKIKNFISQKDFNPDFIVGHFFNPQIEIISNLKKSFPDAVTSIVVHEKAEVLNNLYGSDLYNYKNIDFWGFRSKSMLNGFFKLFWKPSKTFINHSGIPKSFINSNSEPKIRKELKNFLYVGQLIKRKYPSLLVSALDSTFKSKKYKLSFVGSGSERSKIISEAKRNNSFNKIKLHGQLPSNEVQDHYDKADCFIMISKDEAYGLVYLEAMSRGCITIAAKNEGMDGIIIHGYNGFLCEAGSLYALNKLLKSIDKISKQELGKISQNAINTAKSMSIEQKAKEYIETISN